MRANEAELQYDPEWLPGERYCWINYIDLNLTQMRALAIDINELVDWLVRLFYTNVWIFRIMLLSVAAVTRNTTIRGHHDLEGLPVGLFWYLEKRI